MKPYSVRIVQAIQEYLDEQNIKLVAFDEDTGTFGFVMYLPGKISFLHFCISVAKDDYTVVAVCPVRPGPGDSAAVTTMAEFICRINYGLKNGNFEMNFRNGELIYKSFVNCRGQIPSQHVICDSIGVPAAMMRKYAPGIIDILYRGRCAEFAAEDCELTLNMPHGPWEPMQDFPRMHRTDDLWKRDFPTVTPKPSGYGSFPGFGEFPPYDEWL